MNTVSRPFNRILSDEDAILLHKIASAVLSQAGLRIRLLLHDLKYNRNQPRVPRGSPDGGQWSDGAGGQPNTRVASGRRTGGPTSRLTSVQRINRRQIRYFKRKINQINPRERTIEPLGGANSSRAHNSFKARYETLLSKSKTVSISIANGHGFAKHRAQSGFRQSPTHTRFPDVSTREQYAARIYDTIVNGTHSKALSRGRTAYYNTKNNTIVIANPEARDGGSAYPAFRGERSFNTIND